MPTVQEKETTTKDIQIYEQSIKDAIDTIDECISNEHSNSQDLDQSLYNALNVIEDAFNAGNTELYEKLGIGRILRIRNTVTKTLEGENTSNLIGLINQDRDKLARILRKTTAYINNEPEKTKGDYTHRIHLLMRSGKYQNALSVIDNAISDYPDVLDWYRQKALCASKVDDKQLAIKTLEEVLEKDISKKDKERVKAGIKVLKKKGILQEADQAITEGNELLRKITPPKKTTDLTDREFDELLKGITLEEGRERSHKIYEEARELKKKHKETDKVARELKKRQEQIDAETAEWKKPTEKPEEGKEKNRHVAGLYLTKESNPEVYKQRIAMFQRVLLEKETESDKIMIKKYYADYTQSDFAEVLIRLKEEIKSSDPPKPPEVDTDKPSEPPEPVATPGIPEGWAEEIRNKESYKPEGEEVISGETPEKPATETSETVKEDNKTDTTPETTPKAVHESTHSSWLEKYQEEIKEIQNFHLIIEAENKKSLQERNMEETSELLEIYKNAHKKLENPGNQKVVENKIQMAEKHLAELEAKDIREKQEYARDSKATIDSTLRTLGRMDAKFEEKIGKLLDVLTLPDMGDAGIQHAITAAKLEINEFVYTNLPVLLGAEGKNIAEQAEYLKDPTNFTKILEKAEALVKTNKLSQFDSLIWKLENMMSSSPQMNVNQPSKNTANKSGDHSGEANSDNTNDENKESKDSETTDTSSENLEFSQQIDKMVKKMLDRNVLYQVKGSKRNPASIALKQLITEKIEEKKLSELEQFLATNQETEAIKITEKYKDVDLQKASLEITKELKKIQRAIDDCKNKMHGGRSSKEEREKADKQLNKGDTDEHGNYIPGLYERLDIFEETQKEIEIAKKAKKGTVDYESPEAMLSMVNLYLLRSERENEGRSVDDYELTEDAIEETGRQLAEQEKKYYSGYFQFISNFLTGGIFKPRLTTALRGLGKNDKELKDIGAETMSQLASICNKPDKIVEWIDAIATSDDKEKKVMTVYIPRIISYLNSITRSGNLCYINTASFNNARLLVENLRAEQHSYAKKTANKMPSETNIDAMINYQSIKTASIRTEKGIDSKLFKTQAWKNVALGSTVLAGGTAAAVTGLFTGTVGAIGALAGSGTAGILAAKKSEMSDRKKSILTRGMKAAMLGGGASILGGGAVLIPALVATGAISPEIIKYREQIGKTAGGILTIPETLLRLPVALLTWRGKILKPKWSLGLMKSGKNKK